MSCPPRSTSPRRAPALVGAVVVGLAALAAAAVVILSRDGGATARAAAPPIAAATVPAEMPQRTIQVTGTARFRTPPDRAVVSVGVERDAPEADVARARAGQAFAAVLAALRDGGVPEARLQSSGLRLEPRYSETGRQVTGYVAVAQVVAEVDDIDRLGSLIDAASAAGANRMDGVRWVLRDPDAVRSEALRRAVQNGRAQAAALAEGGGVRLGDLLTMSTAPAYAEPQAEMRMAADPAADATPVAPGELTGEVSVTMSYAIG